MEAVAEYGDHPRVLFSEDMTGEKSCVRVVRQIRPSWKKCDIILWKLSPTSWASYSVKNTRDKLLIKLFPEEAQSARYLNTFQLYSELGLSPRLLGTFSHGLVTEFQPSSDPELLHHAAVYPGLARTVGTLHRYEVQSKCYCVTVSQCHSVIVSQCHSVTVPVLFS